MSARSGDLPTPCSAGCQVALPVPRTASSDGRVRTASLTLLTVTTVIFVQAKGNQRQETAYLEKLGEELGNRGLEAFIMAPPGRVPSLYVVNPAARALEENVYAGLCSDGMWWFWWSWAERIGLADDIDGAAATITRVLSLPRGRD